jgi:hypothetical protein
MLLVTTSQSRRIVQAWMLQLDAAGGSLLRASRFVVAAPASQLHRDEFSLTGDDQSIGNQPLRVTCADNRELKRN